MPTSQTTSLEQMLGNLSGMSQEETISIFKQDLSSVPVEKVVGSLKLAMMFLDVKKRSVVKQSILENLAPQNQNPLLLEYLKQPGDQEIVDEIPLEVVKDSQGYDFEVKLDAVWDILPGEVSKRMEEEPLLAGRLRSIVLTYLKGVRDRLETTQRLVAQLNLGGMELEPNLVDKIFQVIEIEPIQTESDSDQSADISDSRPGGIKIASLDKSRLAQLKQSANDTKPRVPQPPSAPLPTQKPRKTPADSVLEATAVSAPRSAPATRKSDIFTDVARPEQVKPSKKEESKLVSPVDVFTSLTLQDLRHAASPEEFAKKLKDQIELLGVEDYSHKLDAVRAWKKSEVYLNYLDIGQKSLGQGLNVSDYLATVKGEDVLNEHEFQIIGELNLKLRF